MYQIASTEADRLHLKKAPTNIGSETCYLRARSLSTGIIPVFSSKWHQLTRSLINIQSSCHILSRENKMETVHWAYILLMTHLLWSQAVITPFLLFRAIQHPPKECKQTLTTFKKSKIKSWHNCGRVNLISARYADARIWMIKWLLKDLTRFSAVMLVYLPHPRLFDFKTMHTFELVYVTCP